MNRKERIEEVLFQLHQGNFKFAEKLIKIFDLEMNDENIFGFNKGDFWIEYFCEEIEDRLIFYDDGTFRLFADMF